MMSSSSRKSLRSYITERYGSDSYESITRLSKLKTKKARYQNHIIFLKKCRDNNIIPKGLRVKSIANSWKARKIDRDAWMARVRERLESHKHTVSKLIRDASSVETTQQNRLSEDDFQKVMKIIKVTRNMKRCLQHRKRSSKLWKRPEMSQMRVVSERS